MSLFDEAWELKIDIPESGTKLLNEFKSNVGHLFKQVSNQSDSFQVQNFNYSGSAARNSDDELRSITERNKQLVQELKTKVEVYERQQVQYGNYKSDQKQLAKEIKDTHEAFLMAKKYYKKFLKIYFTIESRNDGKQRIFLQFFTDVKKESRNYSVYLLKDEKTKHYEGYKVAYATLASQLVLTTSINFDMKVNQINPSLDLSKEVHQKLQSTNDVPGALCYIRQAFMKSSKNKNK